MTESDIAKLIAENISPLMASMDVVLSIAKWIMGIMVAAVIAAITFAYKVSAYKTNLQHDIQDIKNDVQALKSDSHALKGDMQHLTKKIHHMDSYLVRLDAQLSSAPMYQSVATFTQSSSPLTLTASGEELVKDSGFLDVLAQHQGIFDGIIANAKGRVDIEAFIEKEAFQKVEELFQENNVLVSPVAQFMYERGMRQSPDMYQGAIRAFAVAARDAMFKRIGIAPPIAKQHRSE